MSYLLLFELRQDDVNKGFNQRPGIEHIVLSISSIVYCIVRDEERQSMVAGSKQAVLIPKFGYLGYHFILLCAFFTITWYSSNNFVSGILNNIIHLMPYFHRFFTVYVTATSCP